MPASPITRACVCALLLAGGALHSVAQTVPDTPTPVVLPNPTTAGAGAAGASAASDARPAYTRPLTLGQLRQVQQVGRTVLAAHKGQTEDAADPRQLDGLRKAVDALVAAETADARIRHQAAGASSDVGEDQPTSPSRALEHRSDRKLTAELASSKARLAEARKGAREWAMRLEQRAQVEEGGIRKTAASGDAARAEDGEGATSIKANRARLLRQWSERLSALGTDTDDASAATPRGTQVARAAAASAELNPSALARLNGAEQLRRELKASVQEWPQRARTGSPTITFKASRPGKFTAKSRARKA